METKKKASLYFVHPLVDFALIGGISLILLVILKITRPQNFNALSIWAGILVWYINWPHFSATSHRLYGRKENRNQYPMTAYVVPFLVLAMVIGSFLEPVLVAPLFVKIYLIWSSYHFSGQSLGITLVYARRSGRQVLYWEKKILSYFIFASFFVGTFAADTGSSGGVYFGIALPGLGLHQWTVQMARYFLWAMAAGVVLVYLKWSIRDKKPAPLILLVPALAQYAWFVEGYKSPGFTALVPLFHSLQYLLIAWFVNLKEKEHSEKTSVSRLKFIWKASFNWGLINFVGGATLFYVLPRFFSWISSHPLEFSTGVTLAGVQVHHFFVDGVIWKLRDKNNGTPLMGTLSSIKLNQDRHQQRLAA